MRASASGVSSCLQLLDVAGTVDQKLQQLGGGSRIAGRAEAFHALLALPAVSLSSG